MFDEPSPSHDETSMAIDNSNPFFLASFVSRSVIFIATTMARTLITITMVGTTPFDNVMIFIYFG
jgi:hypothetical protein